MGSSGLEPPTSRLSGVCSNQLSYEPVDGGGKRVRTDDPLLAGQVLYQLSYTPIYINAYESGNIKINAPLVGMHKFVLKMNKKETLQFLYRLKMDSRFISYCYRFSLKGGDPAAPSDTATLLRLNPSHWYYLRQLPPCG